MAAVALVVKALLESAASLMLPAWAVAEPST